MASFLARQKEKTFLSQPVQVLVKHSSPINLALLQNQVLLLRRLMFLSYRIYSPGTSLPLIVFPLLTFILFCFFRPLFIFDIFPRTYVRTISCTLGFLSHLKTTTFAFIAELSIKLEVLSMSTYNYLIWLTPIVQTLMITHSL